VSLQQIVEWLRRLVYLDLRVFEEVRSNPTATIGGVLIAAGSIFLSGIGGFLWWVTQGYGAQKDIAVHSMLLGSLLAVVLWGLVWLGLVYIVLTWFFRERAYVEQLLRVMGMAATPMALGLLMFIPGISLGIGVASLALTFGLTTLAIQSVTTGTPARVLVANACGFFVWASALTLFASSSFTNLKPHAPGVFLFNATAGIADEVLDLDTGTPTLAP